jgi:hypothetical protein
MKIKFIAILVPLMASVIYGQPWNNNPPRYEHLIAIEDLPPIPPDYLYAVKARTQQQELNYYGVPNIVTQETYNSYHIFMGDEVLDGGAVLLLPPGWIGPDDLWGQPYKFRHIYNYMPGCSDMPIPTFAGLSDSVYFCAGFGHLYP